MKTKPTNLNQFTPAQLAAMESMRTALAPEMAELDEAANYAHHFAQAFFQTHCVRTAAAWAMTEMRVSKVTDQEWVGRN